MAAIDQVLSKLRERVQAMDSAASQHSPHPAVSNLRESRPGEPGPMLTQASLTPSLTDPDLSQTPSAYDADTDYMSSIFDPSKVGNWPMDFMGGASMAPMPLYMPSENHLADPEYKYKSQELNWLNTFEYLLDPALDATFRP